MRGKKAAAIVGSWGNKAWHSRSIAGGARAGGRLEHRETAGARRAARVDRAARAPGPVPVPVFGSHCRGPSTKRPIILTVTAFPGSCLPFEPRGSSMRHAVHIHPDRFGVALTCVPYSCDPPRTDDASSNRFFLSTSQYLLWSSRHPATVDEATRPPGGAAE